MTLPKLFMAETQYDLVRTTDTEAEADLRRASSATSPSMIESSRGNAWLLPSLRQLSQLSESRQNGINEDIELLQLAPNMSRQDDMVEENIRPYVEGATQTQIHLAA